MENSDRVDRWELEKFSKYWESECEPDLLETDFFFEITAKLSVGDFDISKKGL